MKNIFITFLSFILLSCISTNTSTSQENSSSINFQPPNILEQMQTGYKFDLNVGIFAIDEKNLFLFGSLGEDKSYPLQSTLLKSVDGGKHWNEVLPPQQTSRVIEFQMLESGVGWVLILAIGNRGVGESILFHTIDFGESWGKISIIPRNNYLGRPTFMYFGSEQDGQIDIAYPYEMPNDGYLAHLSTYDGGKTWEETGRYYPKFEEMYSQSNTTHAYWLYKKGYQESISIDRKSYWKLEEYNDELIIKRSLPQPVNDSTGYTIWDEWEVTSILPITLSYENGMIKLP